MEQHAGTRKCRHWWNSYEKLAALHYLGGDVIGSLYKKPKISLTYQSEECQHALSLLSACKSGQDSNQNTKPVIWPWWVLHYKWNNLKSLCHSWDVFSHKYIKV